MKRSGSPQMPRNMLGHGLRMTNFPPASFGTGLPLSSTTSGTMPKKGRVAVPGLVGVAPGSGVIMMPPVSVCHQVSTIGHRLPPMCSRYHIHASGLIGSPTEPSRRKELKSCLFGHSTPHFMNARIAVGAVYKMVTPYFATMRQKRSGSGKFGAPSYMKLVAPLASGP